MKPLHRSVHSGQPSRAGRQASDIPTSGETAHGVIAATPGRPFLCVLLTQAVLPQVAALCAAPFLLDRPDVESIFPKDAIAR